LFDVSSARRNWSPTARTNFGVRQIWKVGSPDALHQERVGDPKWPATTNKNGVTACAVTPPEDLVELRGLELEMRSVDNIDNALPQSARGHRRKCL